MLKNDFGLAFSNTSLGSEDESLRIIVSDDTKQAKVARSTAIERAKSKEIEMVSPQYLASERYGVSLPPPKRGEKLFLGVVRNPQIRMEEVECWPVFSTRPRWRKHYIFTFEVEIADYEGNPVEYLPIEMRGEQINGVLPNDGTPVAVYGSRNRRDRVVRTQRVFNLRTKSIIMAKQRILLF
jgi:hypothetical protein